MPKDRRPHRRGPSKNSGSRPHGPNRHPRNDSSLPEVIVAEVTEIDPDGEALARPLDWKDGRPPRIFLKPGTGHAALDVGQRALLRLKQVGAHTYAGTVLRKVEGMVARVVGVYQSNAQGGRVQPTDRRQKDEVIVTRPNSMGAEDGELVVTELVAGSALGLAQAKVIERLGPVNAPRAVSLIAIHTHELPLAFPESVTKEAEKCPRPTLGDRTDLRDVPLVTIDGADARDFDDAVYAEKDGTGWRLLVAIADVANYVKYKSALDNEAIRRGNSTYFPDRVVPMLPEALSNDLCSLRPNEDRACLAVWMWVDAEGKMTKHEFVRGLMRSVRRWTYEEVQTAHEKGEESVNSLYGAYKTLLGARHRRGTLELDLPERKVVLDDKGRVAEVKMRERLDSHRLIEEFMVLANVAAAEALEAKKMGAIYRVHEPPSLEKLHALREFLDPIGMGLPPGNKVEPRAFAHILQKVAGQPISPLVSMIVLRSQSQALYSPDNRGHFGLALRAYAHFTSPIRRYADLVVHRGLIRAYGLGDGGISDEELRELTAIAEAISLTERRSALAERDAMDRYLAIYMEKQLGAVFNGRINGVTRFGLFVQLDETGADGLIPMHALGDDRYEHDEKRHSLVGQRTGRVIRLGARARVKLVEAAGLSGSLTFQPLEIESDVLGEVPAKVVRKDKAKGKAFHKRRKERQKRRRK